MADSNSISRVQKANLQRKFGNKYKTRDQVEVAIRKLIKKRNQILTRSKIAEARKKTTTLAEFLKEEKKLQKLAQQKRFDPYSIFYFTYKHPVTNPPIWDIRPLVIMLGMQQGTKGRMLLGVNMHWIPRHYRYTFWKYIRITYEYLKKKGKERELPILLYTDIKKTRQLKPAMKAIRKYYLNRIGKVVRVSESDFDTIFNKYKSLKKMSKPEPTVIKKFVDKTINRFKK